MDSVPLDTTLSSRFVIPLTVDSSKWITPENPNAQLGGPVKKGKNKGRYYYYTKVWSKDDNNEDKEVFDYFAFVDGKPSLKANTLREHADNTDEHLLQIDKTIMELTKMVKRDNQEVKNFMVEMRKEIMAVIKENSKKTLKQVKKSNNEVRKVLRDSDDDEFIDDDENAELESTGNVMIHGDTQDDAMDADEQAELLADLPSNLLSDEGRKQVELAREAAKQEYAKTMAQAEEMKKTRGRGRPKKKVDDKVAV